MAKFNGYVLTEKGRELLTKGLAGERITFTKMQIGDGTATTDARNMTALVSPKKDLTLLNINVVGGQCELTALLSNHELRTGFYIRELGVFARGNDDTEILYAYNISPNPDFIPPFNANNIVEIEYVDTLIIDRVANVTAVIDPSITYITKQMADTLYLEKKRLTEIIGSEFGGNVQDIGTKTVGKFYYDTSTKHYFECIANNNLTYVDVAKFKPISNKPISDKLENLSEIRYLKNEQIDSRTNLYFENCTLIKIGNIVIFNGFLKANYSGQINSPGASLLTLPYRPHKGDTWIEPFFTLRSNGSFEVGAHGSYAPNKINNPRHINFVYVSNS